MRTEAPGRGRLSDQGVRRQAPAVPSKDTHCSTACGTDTLAVLYVSLLHFSLSFPLSSSLLSLPFLFLLSLLHS